MAHQDADQNQLQTVIDKNLAGLEQPVVLEAGCGSASHIELRENYYVIGIDISKEQLDRNAYAQETILADVETYDFPGNRKFDLIVCWDVIEHLNNPGAALEKFLSYIADGGLILIAAPNVYSLKGVVTKLTPHWFHVWFYRAIFKSKTAGQPGYAPFPTFLRLEMSPPALRKFAARHGLEVADFHYYQRVKSLGRFSKFAGAVYQTLVVISKTLSLGRYDPNNSDFHIVMKKPGRRVRIPDVTSDKLPDAQARREDLEQATERPSVAS